jgi:excisionase family DNA binding protein
MEELYTIREVAEKLKISISSVYRYVESGRFPHRKIGSNIRFTKENIETFLSKPQKNTEAGNTYPSASELQAIYDQF